MKPTEADYDRALCEHESRACYPKPYLRYWPKDRQDAPEREVKLGLSSYYLLRKAALNPSPNETR